MVKSIIHQLYEIKMSLEQAFVLRTWDILDGTDCESIDK